MTPQETCKKHLITGCFYCSKHSLSAQERAEKILDMMGGHGEMCDWDTCQCRHLIAAQIEEAVAEDRKAHNNRVEEVRKEIYQEGWNAGKAEGFSEAREKAKGIVSEYRRDLGTTLDQITKMEPGA